VDTLSADTTALGYDTQWLCLRAADTGACHRRDRIFILAVLPSARAGLAAAHAGRRGV
jgi:DNA (cytosine-5)-methyltransferase 1